MTFGSTIRALRDGAGENQAEAARGVGITPISWRRYEDDEVAHPKPEVLLRIAHKYGVDVNQLLALTNQAPMADPQGAERRASVGGVLAVLATMPLERAKAMPTILRALAVLP